MKTLYSGGTILTMTQERPQALVTEDGRILAMGDLTDMKLLAVGAECVDLQGGCLMPGFIDGHSHMAGEGVFSMKCDLTGCGSLSELLDRIRRYREKNRLFHGEVIQSRGYDPEIMAEHCHPTAAVLDTLGIDNPILCIHQSGHLCTVNTAAMRYCGVDDSHVFPEGGFAGRDADGHLTGYFEENAASVFRRKMDSVTPESLEKGILAAQEEYFSRGFTTVQDGTASSFARLESFRKLAQEGLLRADIVVHAAALQPEDGLQECLSRFGNREYRGHLKLGGMKIFLDGSPQARTAWMLEPYEGTPDYCGYPTQTDEKVQQAVSQAALHRMQLLAHCNGDAASEQYLRVWEQEISLHPESAGLRPVMVHSQFVHDEQLARMAAIGMLPTFFIGHCWFWGDTHLRNMGDRRARRISPVKSAIDLGLSYSFHQDSPVTKPDMLHSLWCAVNRITRSGAVIGPEFRISTMQALYGATRGAAYQYFEEADKGFLAPGARADMVLLDKDPTAVDPMQLKELQVLMTVKDGKTVFSR